MQKIVYFVMICLAFNACAQNKEKTTEKKKISTQDSLRYVSFLDSASIMPLFSLKRQYFLDSALQIAPKNARLWQQKAMPLFKQKKYELGMPYLDMAVKYDDQTCHFLEYRAFMKCIFQKSYKEALKDFDAVL